MKIFIFKIALIIVIVSSISCEKKFEPDKGDLISKLELPDKEYDISIFRDSEGLLTSDFIDIYIDFRDDRYFRIFHFAPRYYSYELKRYDSNQIILLYKYFEKKPFDTIFHKLRSKKVYRDREPILISVY